MEALLILLALLAIVFGLAFVVYRFFRRTMQRGQELSLLAQQGSTVTGYISTLEKVRKNRAGHHEYFMTYQFQDTGGQEHCKRLEVSASEYSSWTEGQSIDVVYLRAQPQVNSTSGLVDKMRGGLTKAAAEL